MTVLPKEFTHKLARLLNDEEVDLYVLSLHYRNNEDLNYFSEEDRKRVKSILDILIKDTKHHAELLELIVELAER
jgi:hypothetical protein